MGQIYDFIKSVSVHFGSLLGYIVHQYWNWPYSHILFDPFWSTLNQFGAKLNVNPMIIIIIILSWQGCRGVYKTWHSYNLVLLAQLNSTLFSQSNNHVSRLCLLFTPGFVLFTNFSLLPSNSNYKTRQQSSLWTYISILMHQYTDINCYVLYNNSNDA